MTGRQFGPMSLYTPRGERKYLNSAERQWFLSAAKEAPEHVRLFAEVLFWSGSRISEALALTASSIDVDECVVVIETLKRRRPGVMRQIPLPPDLVRRLDRTFGLRSRQRDPHMASKRLWPWSRATAWRHIKALMSRAGITGARATAKGLRHAAAVAALLAVVPLHLVQRWLGHASPETTQIYLDVAGHEERQFAARMWSVTGTEAQP